MESIPTTKKEAFEVIYQNLTRLQGSYRQMIMQCAEQLWHVRFSPHENEPYNFDLQRSLEQNMKIAEDTIIRLERVKYNCSLAILTEGTNLSEKDLSSTINEIELLVQVAKIEASTKDTEINEWAIDKIEHLDNTKNVLLQVLNHKIDAQVKLGRMLYQ